MDQCVPWSLVGLCKHLMQLKCLHDVPERHMNVRIFHPNENLTSLLKTPSSFCIPLSPVHPLFSSHVYFSLMLLPTLWADFESTTPIQSTNPVEIYHAPTSRYEYVRLNIHKGSHFISSLQFLWCPSWRTQRAGQGRGNQKKTSYFHSLPLSVSDIRFRDGDEGQKREKNMSSQWLKLPV